MGNHHDLPAPYDVRQVSDQDGANEHSGQRIAADGAGLHRSQAPGFVGQELRDDGTIDDQIVSVEDDGQEAEKDNSGCRFARANRR